MTYIELANKKLAAYKKTGIYTCTELVEFEAYCEFCTTDALGAMRLHKFTDSENSVTLVSAPIKLEKELIDSTIVEKELIDSTIVENVEPVKEEESLPKSIKSIVKKVISSKKGKK